MDLGQHRGLNLSNVSQAELVYYCDRYAANIHSICAYLTDYEGQEYRLRVGSMYESMMRNFTMFNAITLELRRRGVMWNDLSDEQIANEMTEFHILRNDPILVRPD